MNLPSISKSKLAGDLLGFYFSNADKSYYIRELERILPHSAGNLRRQLLAYTKMGLFYTSRRGNLVFYHLNKGFPLFDEYKSIVSKTIGITGHLKKAVNDIKGVKVAFIYGSVAKGAENEKSDIDICLVGKIDTYDMINALNELEKKLCREINHTIFSEEEFAEKSNEPGSFLNLVLKNKIIPIKGDAYARETDQTIAQ